MNFAEYQKRAHVYAVYPKEFKDEYILAGLISEIGEIAAKVKRSIRDGTPLVKRDLALELGDVLWYVAEDAEDASNLEWADDQTSGGATWGCVLADLAKAAGDVCGVDHFHALVAISEIASMIGYTVERVADMNLAKLADRASRGVLKGKGDDR